MLTFLFEGSRHIQNYLITLKYCLPSIWQVVIFVKVRIVLKASDLKEVIVILYEEQK
jgi:hypothetical protein